MTVEIKGFGKVTGNKDVMAFIEAAFWKVGDSYSLEGFKNLSELHKEIARDIHKELTAKKYYGA